MVGEFMTGKKEWVISDGFMNATSSGDFVSHEAVCVLNLSGQTANVAVTIYFEDREPMKGFTAICENDRTNHIRLDKIVNDQGEKIPREVPYAIVVESDVPIVVQHTRMDVSQAEMALMTTLAYS